MNLSRILLASVAAVALFSAPALADESPPTPAAPAQAAPAPAVPAQAAATPLAATPEQAAQAAPGHSGPAVDQDGVILDADAMKKLTGDQIVEVMRQRALFAAHPRPDEIVPIVIPISFFLFSFFGVYAGLYYSARKDRQRHETLRAMIERGGTLPPEMLVPPIKKHSDLRRGIILAGGGLGLSIFVAATPASNGIWTVGLIPMLIGAGYLITWKLMKSEPQPVRDEAAIAAEREVNNL